MLTDKEIAESYTILRGIVGSTAHGLALPGHEDRDEMGICLEPAECVIGFRRFEQWTYRSQPQGVRSSPGDLDLTIYSLRKYCRLALQGNPTILLLLFIPEEHLSVQTEVGRQLRELAPQFASLQAGERFLGYMKEQRERLEGVRGQRSVTRPELVERYGYDTKYAMHALRLGHQGCEYLETGRLTLPMKPPIREHLLDVRQGKLALKDVLAEVDELENRLKKLLSSSSLPPEPDRETVEKFVIRTYLEHWSYENA